MYNRSEKNECKNKLQSLREFTIQSWANQKTIASLNNFYHNRRLHTYFLEESICGRKKEGRYSTFSLVTFLSAWKASSIRLFSAAKVERDTVRVATESASPPGIYKKYSLTHCLLHSLHKMYKCIYFSLTELRIKLSDQSKLSTCYKY